MEEKPLWKNGKLRKIADAMKEATHRISQGMGAWVILILGDYKPPEKLRGLRRIRDALRNQPNNLSAFLIDDLINETPGMNDTTRMRMAIDQSDVILAVDGNSPGFAVECTYIVEYDKHPHKAILFIDKNTCDSVNAVLDKNDYKTLFCNLNFYGDESELIGRCIETAKHRCKRLSMYAENRKKSKV